MGDIINSVPFAVGLLLVGFFLLVKGADLFVEGSSSVAKRLRVPSIIIGLTIVAMGTSLPEAAVSVTASMANRNTLAISNVTGSNIFNLMAVIGFCAVMTPVAVQRETIRRDLPISILCTLLLLGMGYMDKLMGADEMSLGRLDGVILLVCFAVFLFIMVRSALSARKDDPEAAAGLAVNKEEDGQEGVLPVARCVIYIVAGAAGIILGGNWVVDSASTIAEAAGMSQTLVGLTIVSIGTSLPEFVTSVVAARKKEVDMALGNAIGSNIFNILMVLGLAGTISPISYLGENMIDILILCVFCFITWVFTYTKKDINKIEGTVMLLLYFAYMVYIIVR